MLNVSFLLVFLSFVQGSTGLLFDTEGVNRVQTVIGLDFFNPHYKRRSNSPLLHIELRSNSSSSP